MQTFLPHANMALSVHMLDPARLGKQRVEAVQILTTLSSHRRKIWTSHPAVLMWRDRECALALYAELCIREWVRRGYVNTMVSPRSAEGAERWRYPREWATGPVVMPEWLGEERLHASHRAALLHKNESWYQIMGWSDQPRLDYFWPGRIPRPGDAVVGPEQQVGTVMQELSSGSLLVRLQSRAETAVSRRAFYMREWSRGVRE